VINNNRLNEQQLKDLVVSALTERLFNKSETRQASMLATNYEIFDQLCEKVYIPSDLTIRKIEEYEQWLEAVSKANSRKERAPLESLGGKLMEQIAYLVMADFVRFGAARSYQSFAAQIDLLLTVDPVFKLFFRDFLNIDTAKILIEAKNTSECISDSQFRRLCHIVESQFSNDCRLGIFFSREGATGFHFKKGKGRALRDAAAIQALFHARTSRYIIVFEHADIIRMKQVGEFPRLVKRRLDEVEDATLLSPDNFDSLSEVLLPPHLAELEALRISTSAT